MSASIIDGRELARRARADLAQRVERIRAASGRVGLDAILAAGSDPSLVGPARVYAQSQGRTCHELGIDYRLHELEGADFDAIAGRVLVLNEREECSAIMVHLPLPEGIDPYEVQRLIAPQKDVEGVNPANIGNVVYGREGYAPCTALSAMALIESTGVSLAGRHAVVVGASDVVGKPLAVLLMRAEATVTSCNVHTPDVPSLTRRADIVIAAAGVPGLIRADMIRPGAIVIDVGVNRIEGEDGKTRTVGDVAFDEVREVASAISPVPGGVGPMTVAVLLRHVVDAAERACGLRSGGRQGMGNG